jgi:hypothetical protein
MVSRIACSITAIALALTAQVAIAASANHKNCTAKSHQHAKVVAAKPAKPTKWGGGGGGAQMRRTPDIQILSFGP